MVIGAQLLTGTGPKGSNIGLRVVAKSKGMLLNQYGLWKGKTRVAGQTERKIYHILGKIYRVPTQRGLQR